MKNYSVSQIGELDLKEHRDNTEKLHFVIFQMKNTHNLEMSSLYIKSKICQAGKKIKR